MNQAISQIVQLLQQGIAAIFKFIQLVWGWSFGEIFSIVQSNWQALPVWKIAVLGVVMAAIGFVLFKAARQIWSAAEQIFKAFIGLLSALVTMLPYIVVAGALAAGGGWVIKNVNF